MLRQHHLRIPDVKAYLRVFDKNKPSSPTDWAAQESMLYEPGYLIFCLEQVAAPAGLSSFSKKAEEQGETFRVKDLCVVISKDEGQCMVVNVTASAFEFRVLDALMQEKATKAILDGKDFNYLACRPITRLGPNQVKALYQVGSNYAQGGSRRSLTVEGSALEEPVIALIGQLGAKLTPQVGKPVIDIGSVCHMIFTPEGRQDDRNKTLLKSCFAPLNAEELALGELAVQHGIMTQQAINAEQAASPEAFENNPFKPSPAAESAPQIEPQIAEYAPMAVAPPANPEQATFDIPPALQRLSYSNLQPPPQSEMLVPEYPQQPAVTSTEASDFAFDNNATFVPSSPEPAPEFPTATPMASSRYDDTPPWATASADALTAVLMSGDNRVDQQLTTVKMAAAWYEMSHATHDAPATATALLESNAPKEDFSAQFFNDYQQGFAGEAAVNYAENEFEKEKRVREEFEAGKQQRLKDHFGDQHYDKFVKGEAQAEAKPEGKFDSWDLDPNAFAINQESTIKESDYDADIFSNAARGTIETNPDAIMPVVAEEPVVADPDSWMDYRPDTEPAATEAASLAGQEAVTPLVTPPSAPSIEPAATSAVEVPQTFAEAFAPEPFVAPAIAPLPQAMEEHSQGWGASSPSDWHGEKAPLAELIQPGLTPDPVASQATSEAEWSTAVESSFAQPAELTAAGDSSNSLFERLTQQLSKDSPTPDLQMGAAPVEEEQASQQVWHQGTPVSELNPVDLAPPADLAASSPLTQETGALNSATDSAGFWSTMDPTTSLFTPEVASEVTPEFAPAAEVIAEIASNIEPQVAEIAAPLEAAPLESAPVKAALESIATQPAAAPEAIAESLPETMTDSQVMQTRVRPRDYSSPLRRSSELAGGADAPQLPLQSTPILTPTNTLTPSPLSSPSPFSKPQVQAPAAAMPELAQTPEPKVTAPEPVSAPLPVAAPEPAQPALEHSPPVEAPQVESQLQSAPAEIATPVVELVADLAADSIAEPAPTQAPAPVPYTAPAMPVQEAPAAPASASLYRSAPAMGEFDSGVRPAPAQDARLMMNEMATLMSKLEQQVAKAANKMSSRGEELKVRLNRQVEELLREGQDLEKHAEINLTNLSSELRSRLENLAVDVQNNLSKESEGARSLLSDLDASGLERLESEQHLLSTAIVTQCDQFKGELEKLTGSVQSRLNGLIASRNDELAKLSESILEQLKESHDSYIEKVTQRFERFRERMGEENSSITQSLERNMRSMIEEIDSSLERACEKLRSTKLDLEQTISHTVAVCEMAVAQKTKELLAESILPKLNEQKEILRTMIHDMGKQVATESNSAMLAQLAKLEDSISNSSEQLKRSVEDCLTDLENSGRGLKSGLEETFRRSSQDLVQRTQEVNTYLKDTEKRMLESDLSLKSLAESSTVDAEPELNEERNHALNKLGSLKQQANKDLASAMENNIDRMEDQSEKLFAELTNKRAELTTTIRDSAETNLDRVRKALSAATSAIQAAREKHME
ncbi:hypothetical protein BH11CYA1_BH11CYA1_19470 [soil metagenome]